MAETIEWLDASLVTWHIELDTNQDGVVTNAAKLLVDPTYLVYDESGEHPGEQFATVSLQRHEVLAMLQALEDDWADHCRLADPLADANPLATTQVLGRIDVLVSLLREAADVLQPIDPEDTTEADMLGPLRSRMRDAVTAWGGQRG